MDKFLETYSVPRLNYKELKNINRPIMSKVTAPVIKKPTKKEKPRIRWFHWQILPNI